MALIPTRLQSAKADTENEIIPVVAVEKIPEDIPGKVDYYADKYGVDRELAHYIAKNESRYRANAIGDMNLICVRTGAPVRARGVYQITECYHPNVSDKEAFDADENIKYAIQIIAEGKTKCIQQFSTCRNYYSQK